MVDACLILGGDMKRTSRTHSLCKGSKCPTCNAGKLIPIVYGLPDREVMEKSERGELELGGCIITEVIDPGSGFISGDPALFCSKCEGKFFRNGEQSQA